MNIRQPKIKRRQATREKLLDAAGNMLQEVGMEGISTNLICERAGVTPPALYYYFENKFEVVVALGERLMDSQNEILVHWVEEHAAGGLDAYAEHTIDLLRNTLALTESSPGGVWIERALHSSPRLENVRIESHRYVTDILADAFAKHLPEKAREHIWLRSRMLVEYGYMALEMVHAEDRIPSEIILTEAARLQQITILDLKN